MEYEGNLPLSGDDLIFTIKDAELMDAYFAIITPATSDKVTAISAYEKNYEQTYEAEDAELIGNATAYTKANGGDLARSNRAEVGNMNTENDGVKFTVECTTGRQIPYEYLLQQSGSTGGCRHSITLQQVDRTVQLVHFPHTHFP